MNPFYEELFSHWHVRLRSPKIVMVEDSDEEASDFTGFLQVKEDPYQEPQDENTAEPVEGLEAKEVPPAAAAENAVKAGEVETVCKAEVKIESEGERRQRQERIRLLRPLFEYPDLLRVIEHVCARACMQTYTLAVITVIT